MAGGIAPGNSPGENDIRGQLDRILADPLFQRSPQLSAILRFIIEEKLAGRGGEIKESVIAREVLGCSASFDPHTDPRVRIRVRWLRSKLTEYYQGSGSKDSVGIEVPKGGYKPRFFWRQPTANPADAVAACVKTLGATAEACTSSIKLSFDKSISSKFTWSSTYAVNVEGIKSALAVMAMVDPDTKNLTIDDMVDTSIGGTTP